MRPASDFWAKGDGAISLEAGHHFENSETGSYNPTIMGIITL